MSWNTSLVNRLRYYIGDIDESNEVWTNTQLAKLTAMAAIEVATEVSVNNITTKTFSIDTDVPTITPDPVTDNDLKDSGIGELFVLKAAYIIAISEYRKDAAKYSFLLGIPAISISAMVEFIFSINNFNAVDIISLTIGLISTFFSSLFAIDFLIKYLSSKGLKLFIYYRIIFGIVILLNL